MLNSAEAGRAGNVRSDCLIRLERLDAGEVIIDIESKVDVLYGSSIRRLVEDVLRFYGLTGIRVSVTDTGALPYTLAARLETAITRLSQSERREYLLPYRQGIHHTFARDHFRRSRLYLPGNDPKLAINAGIHGADGIILDLEDSVAPTEKDAARILVRNALREVDFMGAERMVRINQGMLGFEDLDMIIPQKPNTILVPKVEDASQVRAVHEHIEELRSQHGMEDDVFLMPIIESAKGAMFAYDIATAAPSVVALAVGLEDYTADIGAERTLEGQESLWMRGAVLNASRAAGVQAIDTVFSDVDDMEALYKSVIEAKSLGFDGKGCIHPRQIAVVHRAFTPSAKEIEKAKNIVRAFEYATDRGLGVVALGSKMIDPPVVKRAQRCIDLAVTSGLLSEHWKEEGNEV